MLADPDVSRVRSPFLLKLTTSETLVLQALGRPSEQCSPNKPGGPSKQHTNSMHPGKGKLSSFVNSSHD